MSTNNSKAARREEAVKKAKQKKLVMITVCAVIAIAIVALVVVSLVQQSKNEVYTDGSQTITLKPDGKFTAALAHETKSGTYTKLSDNGNTTVLFSINGETVESVITGETMELPHEWEDGHGHGGVLTKK